MFAGINQSLVISVVENAHEAVKQGYFYREPIYKPVQIEHVVVVKNGTEGNKSTVDLILVDEKGQKYCVMLTGALLRSIPTEF